jgi:1,4-dihydroxy-2-naphthoate octaprenyltransferase
MASASHGNLPSMAPRQLAIVSAALIVIGCVLAAVGTATALDAVGIAVAGVGLVGLVAAAFYAVGQSEDRAREREDAEHRRD